MIMDLFKTSRWQNLKRKKGLMTSPIYFWKRVEIKPFSDKRSWRAREQIW